MTFPETSWNTRLAVHYTDATGEHEISPISSFVPTFATSAEPLHSIERTHVGVVATPQSLTFSMTVNAIGPRPPSSPRSHWTAPSSTSCC